MNKQPENPQQVANRHHARINNRQRIRYVLGTRIIDGVERRTLEPTTDRDRSNVLPENTPYLR
jgi:hypothetical protein